MIKISVLAKFLKDDMDTEQFFTISNVVDILETEEMRNLAVDFKAGIAAKRSKNVT